MNDRVVEWLKIGAAVVGYILIIVGWTQHNWWPFAFGALLLLLLAIDHHHVRVTIVTEPDEGENSDGD